jgi:hypothetical protein
LVLRHPFCLTTTRAISGRMQNTAHDSKKLALSRAETAEALGVSAITIDRLTKRGLLKPSRATRRPLYPLWEIERFLKDTTQGAW